MIEIYSLKIDGEADGRKFDSLLQYVDKEKQTSVKAFYRVEDYQRALGAATLIRSIAMDKLGISNCEIQFGKNEYGKPLFKGFPDFHFNLSHSGEWVVCAIDNEQIGIDVEKISSIDLSIADRFFSKQEVQDIHSKSKDEQLPYFYDIWTLKESYIKAWGKGLSIPLDSFSLRVHSYESIELETNNSFRECFFQQYNIDNEYKLSVCSLKSEFPERIIRKSIDDILSLLENNHLKAGS